MARHGYATPHLEVFSFDALFLHGRHVGQIRKTVIPEHTDSTHRARFQVTHEFQRVANRSLHMSAEQRGQRFTAGIKVNHVEFGTDGAAEDGDRHLVGGSTGREVHAARRGGAGRGSEGRGGLVRTVGAHEQEKVIEHDIHNGTHFAQCAHIRHHDRRDLGGAIDQHQRVRIGAPAGRNIGDAHRTPAPGAVHRVDGNRH